MIKSARIEDTAELEKFLMEEFFEAGGLPVVMKEIEKIALEVPGVGHILDVSGQSFILNAISSR